MTHSLPTRRLPERPDLNQLKRQAKDLLKSFLAFDESTITEVNRPTLRPMTRLWRQMHTSG